jgi:hypothetical protein
MSNIEADSFLLRVLRALKLTVILAITLAITGCSGSLERMSSWMGVEREILMQELGSADRVYQSQFGSVYSWYRNNEDQTGCTDDFTLKGDVVIGFASSCGIFGGWGVPVYEPNNP